MAISVGSAAPDFTLKDQNQKEVKLSDFKGKKNVVIVFYPLDWSPVCTNEHACFVNDMKSFEQLDAQVLGVSVDSAWSHKAFAEKMGIQLSAACGFSTARRRGRKVRRLSCGQGNHRPSHRHRGSQRKCRVVQELRYSDGAGHQRSFRARLRR